MRGMSRLIGSRIPRATQPPNASRSLSEARYSGCTMPDRECVSVQVFSAGQAGSPSAIRRERGSFQAWDITSGSPQGLTGLFVALGGRSRPDETNRRPVSPEESSGDR
jgi:hypothetical protein